MATTSTLGVALGSSELGDGSTGQMNPTALQLLYANILSGAAITTQTDGARVLVMGSGAIGMAGAIQIGVSETATEQQQNFAVLQEIANYCIENNISVWVDANLTNPISYGYAQSALVMQWATAAAAAGLPITLVEDIQEVGSVNSASYATDATAEVGSVETILRLYQNSPYHMTAQNLSVGDMEGGLVSTITSWWNQYDEVALAAGMPEFSVLTDDPSQNDPWIVPTSSWQSEMESYTTFVAQHNASFNTVVEGILTDDSDYEATAESEQKAIEIAKLQGVGSIGVSNLIIKSWEPYPTGISMVSSPTSETNEVAVLDVLLPNYEDSFINAGTIKGLSTPGQLLATVGNTTKLSGIAIDWDSLDLERNQRLAVILIDQSGTLSSTPSGSGLVQSLGNNVLMLAGNSVDLAAELASLTVTEESSGADTVDVEIFDSNGRADTSQISVFVQESSSFSGPIQSSNPAQGWLTSSASFETSNNSASGPIMTSETLIWSAVPGTLVINGETQTLFQKFDAVHLPLFEYGVESNPITVSGTAALAIEDIYDPTVDSPAYPTNGYANNPGANQLKLSGLSAWDAFAFNSSASATEMTVTSTVNSYDPVSGEMNSQTDTFLPVSPSVTGHAGTSVDMFATDFGNGGSQVVEYNTGTNPAWQAGWGSQFSSVTSTYDENGALVDRFFQGGASDSSFTLEEIFDPVTGALWELFQTAGAPSSAPGFETGPMFITQFDTKITEGTGVTEYTNPNWDGLEWGYSVSAVTELWTDYFVMAIFKGFASNYNVASAPYSYGYSYEFVNGYTLDLIQLPGTISVNLNNPSSAILGSGSQAVNLAGITSIDAWGASGSVTITGLTSGHCSLTGGDFNSIINGYLEDTITTGNGTTTVNTGAGGSSILVTNASSKVSVYGNNNTITLAAGASLSLFGSNDTVQNMDNVVESQYFSSFSLGSSVVGGISELSPDATIVLMDSNINLTCSQRDVVDIGGDNDVIDSINHGTVIAGLNCLSARMIGDDAFIQVNAQNGSFDVEGTLSTIVSGVRVNLTLEGQLNTASLGYGSCITDNGYYDILYVSGAVVDENGTCLQVFGNNNTICGEVHYVSIFGSSDTVSASGSTINIETSTSKNIIVGSWDAIGGTAGDQIEIIGTNDMVYNSNQSIVVDSNSTVALMGSNCSITAGSSSLINLYGVGGIIQLADGVSITGANNISFYTDSRTDGLAIQADSVNNRLYLEGSGYYDLGNKIQGIGSIYLGDGVAGLTCDLGNPVTIFVSNPQQIISGGAQALCIEATAANAGVLVTGSKQNVLEITTSGDAFINANDTDLLIIHDCPGVLHLGSMSFVTAVAARTGGDQIDAGGSLQTIESLRGSDTLIGSSAGSDTFEGSASVLASDDILDFIASDTIDVADLNFSKINFSFQDGTLRASDGTREMSLTLQGISATARMSVHSDGVYGCDFTLVPA